MGVIYLIIHDYRKLTFHEIKVLEINANLVENDFQLKKINVREMVTKKQQKQSQKRRII